MKKVLGIDIGGTSVKAGLFSAEGAPEGAAAIPTGDLANPEGFARVVALARRLLANAGVAPGDLAGIGLDVPGPVDDAGRVGMLANIALDPDGLRDALRSEYPQVDPVFVNDANAAALGELWQGAAKGVADFVLVAIGTGVGGGVVCNGRLVSGAFGAGGEIGHITVNRAETAPCGCGRRGCLEQYASALGIVRAYGRECARRGIAPVQLDGPTDTLSVFKAHQRGDAAAKAAVSAMADALGYALAQVSVLLDPPLYLVGGGVGGGLSLFADELQQAFRAYCLPVSAATRIAPAALGNDAAMYGSAFTALRRAGLPVSPLA